MHGIVQRSWMLQHDLFLNLRLQTAQVGNQYILCQHDMPHLQHQASEFFVIFCHSSLLSQVEYLGLVTELVVHILELGSNVRGEVHPGAYS